VLSIYFPRCPSFSTIQISAPNVEFTSFFVKFKSGLVVKKAFFLLNSAFAVTVLDLISLIITIKDHFYGVLKVDGHYFNIYVQNCL